MNQLSLSQAAGVEVVRAAKPVATPVILGPNKVRIEHWRNGEQIDEFEVENALTYEGKACLLNVMFHGSGQPLTWYEGLIDNANFTAEAATDTYVQINGTDAWKEYTSYTDANNADNTQTRPEWPEGAASGSPPTITNSTPMIYNITVNGTVKGVFVAASTSANASVALKSNTNAVNGVLWATADFSSSVTVQNGDQLKVTYTVTS